MTTTLNGSGVTYPDGTLQTSAGTSSTYIDQDALFSGQRTSLVLPGVKVMVNGTLVSYAGGTLS